MPKETVAGKGQNNLVQKPNSPLKPNILYNNFQGFWSTNYLFLRKTLLIKSFSVVFASYYKY